MAFNVKTFYTRATTALVFVALLLGCIWYNYLSFILFFSVVSFIGLYEFFKLSENLNAYPSKTVGYALNLLAIVITIWYPFIQMPNYLKVLPYLFVVVCFFLFILELFSETSSLQNIAYLLLSLLYVTAPCCMLISMALHFDYTEVRNVFQPQRIIGMIFFIWLNDTGAYFIGSFFGKHKLYEKISPNKTWEGTLGGIAFCIGLSFVVASIFPQLAQIHWIAISIIVAVFGTLGDLVESMLKRMAGVKDSGSLMPGHGGVLDRFDSLFFATPFVFCYLALMGLL
ncbi:MAG TPA: phosphatidate cytidylyltransferase [Bacteroidia bacterium]|nr:phosphatidate cytidylyltransferase [Bacteroidia bacterium]